MLRVITLMLFAIFAIAAGAEGPIDFNKDIRPILSGKCFACHGPDEAERGGKLRLDTQEGSRKDLGGYAAVAPGDVSDSELIYRVLHKSTVLCRQGTWQRTDGQFVHKRPRRVASN